MKENIFTIKRRWAALGLATLMGVASLGHTVHAQSWIHEEKSQSIISSGVIHEEILRFGESGWQRINVIRVDLKDPHVELDLLQSAKGVSQRDTLTNMMKQMENPVAGINGDFFYLTQPDSPMGIMIRDGKIVSSPVIEKPFSSLIITKDRRSDLVDWTNHLYVSTDSGNLFSVAAYNKITWNYHRITILDSNWGEMSPGAADDYADLVEIVVDNGIVREIRRGLPPVSIPEKGFVLLASGQQGQTLLAGIRQGEGITFHSQTLPVIDGIQLAVGGGTRLVQNGQIVSFSEPVTGNHPRTAVGINRNKDQLIMVTVDGRHRSYTGVDGQRLAALMIELGSDQAVLMDGGGSTTMAARKLGAYDIKLVNTPSDGSQRRIINSLAVGSNAPRGNLAGLLYVSDQTSVFVNHSLELSINGYDQYYQPYEIDPAAVRYRVISGNGRIDQQRLIPETEGELVVEASYGGKTVTKKVHVLSQVSAIQIHVPRYTINPGDSLSLLVEGIDPNGYRAPLTFDRVTLRDDQGLGSFGNGTFTAGNRSGATVIRASYNGQQAAVPVTIGLNRQSAGSPEQYRPSFLGYPAEVSGSLDIVSGVNGTPRAVKLNYDLTGSLASTAAYLVFEQGISIPSPTTRIALQVYAEDTAPHWIRGQLRDGNGQVQTLDFKQGIDWTGWKNLEAAIPSNAVKPLILERLYVVEPDPFFKTRGSLIFDGLEFLSPYSLPVLMPEERGGQVSDPLNRIPGQIDKSWLVHTGTGDEATMAALLDQIRNNVHQLLITGKASQQLITSAGDRIVGGTGGYNAKQDGRQLIVTLDNSQDGLRRTNFQQWPWLINLLSNTQAEHIVVLMPKPIFGPGGFGDELEAQLLADQFGKLTEKGKQVLVFYGNGTFQTELMDGVRYIGVDTNEKRGMGLYLSNSQLYFSSVNITDQAPAANTGTEGGTRQVSFRVGQRYYMADGQQIQLDTAPYIKDSRLMVPVAHISRALGLPRENIEWDGLSETVLVRTQDGKTLLMTIGSSQLWVDDQPIDMGVAAEITNDRSFVPISRFAAALGVQYQWLPETETVVFN